MGISASSLLDENKSNFIKGRAQQELDAFRPLYKQQYSVEYCNNIRHEMDHQEEHRTQLLKQREALKEADVLYEETVLYFDDTRKWRNRFVVVRANYSLECHESYETFIKGLPPRLKLLPTGGVVVTTEEKYMALVDQCFPDANNVKEDFAPPVIGMPGQFPVYLRLPYRRDYYFCFKQEAMVTGFLAILNDCIRHQNQDFLKKDTVEVKAFLQALKLHRESKDQYESWNLLIGSDVRVLSNLLMEDLLPSLEKEMLPKLKAKKTERKRVWFATVEAAYILVQEHLLEGLNVLKEECRTSCSQQEGLLRSGMDQINNSKEFIRNKLTAIVTPPAESHCTEHVQPFLASVLEELMRPVSSGFEEARFLGANSMDQLCQDFQEGVTRDKLKAALARMGQTNLQSCYQMVGGLQDQLNELQQRFNYTHITGLVHSTQIDIQQLTENMAYTFELLLLKALEGKPENWALAMERAKNRVLKQYDYDSSTVRKRIFHKALIDITLPSIKRNLAPTVKDELPKFEQYIFADHSPFIAVENVYEDILLKILETEVSKVVKEAVSMKRYNLISEMSREHFSQSSIYSLRTPPGSTPGSPARAGSLVNRMPQPTSPLLGNGIEQSPCSSGPCSPLSEEIEEETQPEASTAAKVADTLAKDGESPSTTDSTAEEAEQVPSPAVESVSSEKVALIAAESTTPASTETETPMETPSGMTVEEVAATVVADIIASVSKETAEAPSSPVTTETVVDQEHAAVEESDTANTMATPTLFDIPGIPATVSTPETETHPLENQAPSEPACEPSKEAAADTEQPSQADVTAAPESPAQTEACVDLPAGEESVVEATNNDDSDAEGSCQEIFQETAAKEISVDVTEQSLLVSACDPSSTWLEVTSPMEVTRTSDALPADSEAELCGSETATSVSVNLEAEECIVIECFHDRKPKEVEAAVDEVPVNEVPVNEVPVNEVPVDEVPANEVPVNVVPVGEVPTNEVPVSEVPVDEVPVDQVPVDKMPVDQVPVDEVPVDEVPVDEVLVSEVPVDEVPMNEVPVDGVPMDEVPIKALQVTEVELGVDDEEAAVDLSDSEDPQPEEAEVHKDLEKSVDAELVVLTTADPESAEVEQCVDSKEGSVEGNNPDQSPDQPAAEKKLAEQPDNLGPASPKASEEAASVGESSREFPLDSVKEIRDLIVEVIEVEEPVQHYPQTPKE